MKKFLAVGLVCVLATSANAAILGLQTSDGSLHPPSDPLIIFVSETAEIQMALEAVGYDYLGSLYSEQLRGANVFMDSVEIFPGIDPTLENMEIIDVTRDGDPDWVWNNIRGYNVPPMNLLEFGPVPEGTNITWDQYYMVANHGLGGPYFDGPTDVAFPNAGAAKFIIDTITVHCTGESIDELWFENEATFQSPTSPSPRANEVFDASESVLPLMLAEGGTYPDPLGTNSAGTIASFNKLAFRNAFQGGAGKTAFVLEPFVVEQVIPEPASLALLALGGLAVLRRRK